MAQYSEFKSDIEENSINVKYILCPRCNTQIKNCPRIQEMIKETTKKVDIVKNYIQTYQ